jgi:hypothetical protein
VIRAKSFPKRDADANVAAANNATQTLRAVRNSSNGADNVNIVVST